MKTPSQFRNRPGLRRSSGRVALSVSFLLLIGVVTSPAKKPYRNAFFNAYPNAVNTGLDDLPSNGTHCGICHYDFDGKGTRNPYGVSLEAMAQANGVPITGAFSYAENLDPDGDGLTSGEELNPGPGMTPGFPGWSQHYFEKVVSIPPSEVAPYLVPHTTTLDTVPPAVTVLSPNGGAPDVTGNIPTTVTWSATDSSGIAAIHIYVSLDGGITFRAVDLGLPDTGSYTWIPASRTSTTALIQVVAVDGAGNIASDDSDSAFTILRPPGGVVPTTLRDFDMPGTQPFEHGADIADPTFCANCHGDYDPAVEPYRTWQGSMMAQASLDPLFLANMAIANQDAPDSGDLCLRCHLPNGWMEGRSVPTDGSAMLPRHTVGVSCDLCHRMVDPHYQPGVSPPQDLDIIAALSFADTQHGNGMMVLDPASTMRGPFADAAAPHNFTDSAFLRDSALCGTCHDVSNPAFTKDGGGIYQPNAFDATSTNFSAHSAAPVERTYSEWLNSEYAASGVYQPEFAGTKADGIVSSCMDCHMRDVSGAGANFPGAPTRDDLPLHDLTGASTWLPTLLPGLYPGEFDADEIAALNAGVDRATYMLENAASLDVSTSGSNLVVTVTNQTGHKLPTGYPEGRRIWLNVKFFDTGDNLISESAAYNTTTGELDHDPEAKIYEVHPGIGDNIDEVVGLPVGPSLHFVLNNQIFEDNRIPPRGFTNAAFEAFGGAPVGHSYADGQYWDDTDYTIPPGTARAEVKLYYQSTSKEFIEFLRDENDAPPPNDGTVMYDLWDDNGKCPPTLMEEATWTAPPSTLVFAGLESASPGIESATLSWWAATTDNPPVTYSVYHSTASGGQDFGTPLLTTTNLSEVISPLDPGQSAPLTHYFVVRASDDSGASEANTVEHSVQPLLDPTKDQDSDGLVNSYEIAHSLDPFNAADALLDPDQDGLTTIEEAAFGSDPDDNGSAHRPRAARVDDGGQTYFALSFTRSEDPDRPNIVAEISDNLMTWDSGPAFTTVVSATSNGDGTEEVVIRMNTPMGADLSEFMRLRVSP